MGAHNAITEEKYKQLKSKLHVSSDDKAVCEKFGISKTTCRMIRNTKDYSEYCEKRFRYHGNPKKTPARSVNKTADLPPMLAKRVSEREYSPCWGVSLSVEPDENSAERELIAASRTIRRLLVVSVTIIVLIGLAALWVAVGGQK